ncbi:MAG TPA: G1 family glutamic endopeptidase [Ktedonobacteraceae bacterium]|nr:G1 family glutamic endopeptidase [Ktedonobacteraceae bacterium]
MKLTHRLSSHFLMKCLRSVLVAFALAVFFPLVAFAQQHEAIPASASTKSAPCLQASASLDVTKLSDAQLQAYGLPVRPLNADAQAIARWLQRANRIKTHRHICQPPLVTGPKQHHSGEFHSPAGSPNTTEYNSPIWAGNYAIQPLGSYVLADDNWNLPCLSTKYLNASASEWVGIGGAGNDSGYLIQTGTDEIIGNSSQKITYTGWVEAFGIPDHTLTWTLTSALCRDPVTTEVTSNLDSDGYDYYMIDVANLDFSHIEYWPTSDGATGECIVENPNNKNQYPNFTDFNYIGFTGCDINSTPINDLTHDYNNMYNNGHYLATTGPISNGDDYTITWKNPS